MSSDSYKIEINFKVKKRDGKIVSFDPIKITDAIKKAFSENSLIKNHTLEKLTVDIIEELKDKYSEEKSPHIEDIQDIVEAVLIKHNFAFEAKRYILYRQKRSEERKKNISEKVEQHKLSIVHKDGKKEAFDINVIEDLLKVHSKGLSKVDIKPILNEIKGTVYDGIKWNETENLITNAIKSHIENHYEYSKLSARIAVSFLYKSILENGEVVSESDLAVVHKKRFKDYLKQGIDLEMLDSNLLDFDLDKITDALDIEKDKEFMFLGMQTIIDRYLIRDRTVERNVIELPQWMWMRISMGLARNEKDKEKWAIEFYNTLSSMNLISSTPTLFNSGTTHSQMSSCYINSVDDSLSGIFKTISDCGQLSKWAGGIGTDWTRVRSKNADIKGTNGKSQGVIPFVRIFNDVALAVNQGGKRKGALAAYLENWHSDVLEFIELRKNTGDERRRAHDIHPVLFISDLFMKRVREKGKWTLFSPDTVPELTETYGKEFEKKYEEYEKQDILGKKTIEAVDLWRKMLTMLYETGHPWLTFKDAMNVRNPQDHAGIIRSSNLCTEIALNTSNTETAVCNLASVNLSRMVEDKIINKNKLEKTITTGMRMLDNVIDENFYPIPEAKGSNSKHRPVGLGMMGYQDLLYQMEVDFDSEENIDLADEIMEIVSYYAIMGSSLLAKEKGPYDSFKGSKWDRGIFPYDTVKLLEEERGVAIPVDMKQTMDWTKVKEHVKEHGMRNSNTMAIAPTATISNIAGATPGIEPMFKNIYMKENLSGSFVVMNRFLIDELEKEGLWTEEIKNKIKFYNGSVLNIDEIPANIRRRYKETFEIAPQWIIKSAARRMKWIDQAASTNIFLDTTSGKILSDIYMKCWEMGLKTTYYLRTLAASQVTKTVQIKEANDNTKREKPKLCSIDNPDCESCQ